MLRVEYGDMTSESRVLALGEVHGWKFKKNDDGSLKLFNPIQKQWVWIDNDPSSEPEWYIHILPRYLNDLNATHSVWKTLTEPQHSIFRLELQNIVVRDGKLEGHPAMSVCNATAEQRSEAFLRTLNLWDDSK